MDDLSGYVSYDRLAIEPLRRRGWAVEEVSWRDDAADWSAFDAVVVRTTWDYHRHPLEFSAAIDRIAAATHLENSARLIKWNIDKHYLKELAAAGVPIVPTLFTENPAGADQFAEWRSKLGAAELILKPSVSANSDNTFRTNRLTAQISSEMNGRAYMVQPFLSSILTEGEYSLFFFGGEYSHAVVKRPASGDFRVQEEHGGIIRNYSAPKELLSAAENVLLALVETPLYARVDLVRGDSGFELMELELIEPSLYFQYSNGSAELFAAKFAEKMNEL